MVIAEPYAVSYVDQSTTCNGEYGSGFDNLPPVDADASGTLDQPIIFDQIFVSTACPSHDMRQRYSSVARPPRTYRHDRRAPAGDIGGVRLSLRASQEGQRAVVPAFVCMSAKRRKPASDERLQPLLYRHDGKGLQAAALWDELKT